MIVNIHYFLFKLFQLNTIVLNFTVSFLPTINFYVFHIHPIILTHPILHFTNILNDLPITIHLNFLMEKMPKVHITFHPTYEDYYNPILAIANHLYPSVKNYRFFIVLLHQNIWNLFLDIVSLTAAVWFSPIPFSTFFLYLIHAFYRSILISVTLPFFSWLLIWIHLLRLLQHRYENQQTFPSCLL